MSDVLGYLIIIIGLPLSMLLIGDWGERGE